MSSPLLAALSGRCPACGKGRLYEGFLMLHELCPSCGVRYEREVSTRTIATILAFGVGAACAFGASGVLRGLGAATWTFTPLAMAFGGVLYPLFRSVAVFLLWQNGLVTVDAPEAPPAAPEPPLPEPFALAGLPILALPTADDPTSSEPRSATPDESTEER